MLLAIILILIPLIAAGLCFVSGKKIAPIVGLFGTMLSFFYFLYMLTVYNVRHELMYNTFFNWIPEIKGIFHVGIDGYSIIPLLLTQLVMLFSLLYALNSNSNKPASYFGLLLLTQAFLNGFFIAQNPI